MPALQMQIESRTINVVREQAIELLLREGFLQSRNDVGECSRYLLLHECPRASARPDYPEDVAYAHKQSCWVRSDLLQQRLSPSRPENKPPDPLFFRLLLDFGGAMQRKLMMAACAPAGGTVVELRVKGRASEHLLMPVTARQGKCTIQQ